jgi:hypothetical protein
MKTFVANIDRIRALAEGTETDDRSDSLAIEIPIPAPPA